MALAQQLCNILKKNIRLCVCIFLIGIFSYGFEICNFSLGIDEEAAFGVGAKNFIAGHASINRWAMFPYYYLLLPGVFYPFTGSVIALFSLSLSLRLYFQS